MGLIILTVVGAVLGWLASILLEQEDSSTILSSIAAGIAGAWVAAIIAGGAPLHSGLGGLQLVWATLGALVAIVVLNLVRQRVLR